MGKELKVIQYELTFGGTERLVNVFSVFRYKKSNNLYVIYSDVGNEYPIIYYGSSHIKNTSILSMTCKEEDSEIIKEYIFNTIEKKELENFEILPLDDINGIEIISSNRLEVKPEVLNSLTEITIPKKEEKKEETNQKPKKKKNPLKTILILIILLAIGFFGYNYYTSLQNKDNITKTITCTNTSSDSKIKATVEESSIYSFNNNDTLENVETTLIYQFNTKEDYDSFIYTGTMYKYMPDNDKNGGFKQDEEKLTFTTIGKENITDSYNKPTNYEEVLSYYKKDGYTCEEQLIGE